MSWFAFFLSSISIKFLNDKNGNLINSCSDFRFDEGEWVDIQSRGQFGNPADFFARDMAVYVYLFVLTSVNIVIAIVIVNHHRRHDRDDQICARLRGSCCRVLAWPRQTEAADEVLTF